MLSLSSHLWQTSSAFGQPVFRTLNQEYLDFYSGFKNLIQTQISKQMCKYKLNFVTCHKTIGDTKLFLKFLVPLEFQSHFEISFFLSLLFSWFVLIFIFSLFFVSWVWLLVPNLIYIFLLKKVSSLSPLSFCSCFFYKFILGIL